MPGPNVFRQFGNPFKVFLIIRCPRFSIFYYFVEQHRHLFIERGVIQVLFDNLASDIVFYRFRNRILVSFQATKLRSDSIGDARFYYNIQQTHVAER
jgi:hypothetical protein